MTTRDGRVTGVVLERRPGAVRARWSSRPSTRRSRSSSSSSAPVLPERVRARHRALEDAQRHGEGQPRDRQAADVHRRPGVRPRDRRRRDRAARRQRAAGAGLPGRAVRRGSRRARSATPRSRRSSTRRSRPRASTRCRCSASGCPADWADDEDDHWPRARGLRRSPDPALRRRGARVQATACSRGRSSARSRCRRAGT